MELHEFLIYVHIIRYVSFYQYQEQIERARRSQGLTNNNKIKRLDIFLCYSEKKSSLNSNHAHLQIESSFPESRIKKKQP